MKLLILALIFLPYWIPAIGNFSFGDGTLGMCTLKQIMI